MKDGSVQKGGYLFCVFSESKSLSYLIVISEGIIVQLRFLLQSTGVSKLAKWKLRASEEVT